MPTPLHATLPVASDTPGASAWVNRFAQLSQRLSDDIGVPLGAEQMGVALPEPRWVAINHELAAQMGLNSHAWEDDTALDGGALAVLTGNALWPGMCPMASVYSGHQFGQWAGQLGDGRALLLGEIQTPTGPQEVQLKGAGPTPYSRRGDGRAVLRSSIREYLCSEAMHGLGIPTTRALSLIASPQGVRRETIEPAAVVARVAPSFIRFGHFEHFSHSRAPRHHEALQALLDFVVQHHYPELQDSPNRVLALLGAVVERTVALIVDWQSVGFCHGVMNTDNMSILGLTIDYGPFGFLDAFDPDHICNHSDGEGRYSWANQPQVAYWNLRALAQALVPLVPQQQDQFDLIVGVLGTYEKLFPKLMSARWRAKLGLQTEQEVDVQLALDWRQLMSAGNVDFTIAFRRLAQYQMGCEPDAPANAHVRDLFLDRQAFDAWGRRYAQRLQAEASVDAERALRMNRVNPLYVLRNHMAQVAIQRAEAGDASEVQRLAKLLQNPFEAQDGCEADADFPPAWAQSIEVSCSS